MAIQTSPLTEVFEQKQDAIRCPYARYATLRESDPVFHDTTEDVYIVTRHADIEKVTTQPNLFSSQNPMGPSAIHALMGLSRILENASPETIERVTVVVSRGNVLLNQDPPVHTRQRRIVNRTLTPRSVKRIEPDIRRVCHELINAFVDDGQVDLVPAYCTPAPIAALLQLLGLPPERSQDFTRWAEALNASIGSTMTDDALRATLAVQSEFWTFCEEELAKRIEDPQDDLLTSIAKAHTEGDEPLSHNEAIGLCSQLITAGSDTTTKHIAAFAQMLCRDNELFARLKKNPEDLPACLEEALRLDSPVQGLFRVATEDTELGGVAIPKGAYVWLVFASGNRDPEVFDQPESYDPDRKRVRPHLAFGHGPHTCIGSPLARAVARVAFEVLLERFDEISLQDPDFVPVYDPSYILRGIKSLPVKFRAAQSEAHR